VETHALEQDLYRVSSPDVPRSSLGLTSFSSLPSATRGAREKRAKEKAREVGMGSSELGLDDGMERA